MIRKRSKIILPLLLILPGLAVADPADLLKELTTKQDKHRHWHGSILAGYNASTGNTQSNSYLTRLKLSYKRKLWENIFNASTERTMNNNDTTAKKSAVDYTSRWLFDKRNYTYFNTDYTHDEFAPFVDVADVGWGYGWRIIKSHKVLLQLQFGPGYQFTKSAEDKVTGKQEEQHTITGNSDVTFDWKINQHVKLEQTLGAIISKDNCFYTSSTALTAALIGHFAMQVGYTASHNTQVPKNSGRAHTDTATYVAIVYAF